MYSENWFNYPKDTPFTVTLGNRVGYAIASAISTLRVLFAATKGTRGGISGQLVVIDSSQQVEIDQLLCSNLDIMRSEDPIRQLHLRVTINKEDFDRICPLYLATKMEEWKKDPKSLITLAAIVGFGQPSVATVQGGTVSPR